MRGHMVLLSAAEPAWEGVTPTLGSDWSAPGLPGLGGGGGAWSSPPHPTCQWSQMPSLSSGDGHQGPGKAFMGMWENPAQN